MNESIPVITAGIASIQGHSTKEDYVMTALSPEDFAKEASTAPLDFDKLKDDFSVICSDYKMPKTFEGAYLAVDFCKKMLYEVGPKSREVRRRQGVPDNTYRFNFLYSTSSGVENKIAIVSTFKNVSYVPVSANSVRMVLTIKEASLLALNTLSEIQDVIYSNTGSAPLCGAVFNYDAVPIIEKGQVFGNVPNICKMLTESCQSGGAVLAHSNYAVALAAVLVTTAGVKDEKIRKSIIMKTVKQYKSANKPLSKDELEFIKPFCNGGIPVDLDLEVYIKDFVKEVFSESSRLKILSLKNLVVESPAVNRQSTTGGRS